MGERAVEVLSCASCPCRQSSAWGPVCGLAQVRGASERASVLLDVRRPPLWCPLDAGPVVLRLVGADRG